MTSILLVSGSYSTGAAWRQLIGHLPKEWMTETVTLPGYDAVEDPRRRDDVDMRHLGRRVAEAARGLPGPVHVAGHSFGVQAVVSAILSEGLKAASLTSFEGNLLSPLADTGRTDLLDTARAFSERFVRAADRGEEDAAGLVIDFWGGSGSWSALSPSIQAFARAGTRSNILDWLGALDFSPDLGQLAKTVPVVSLVRGERACPVMLGIIDAMKELVAGATIEVIPGAGHFLVTTHPSECAAALVRSITRAENQ